jgi:hypothetical protein
MLYNLFEDTSSTDVWQAEGLFFGLILPVNWNKELPNASLGIIFFERWRQGIIVGGFFELFLSLYFP